MAARVLLVAEHDKGKLNAATAKALSCAVSLGQTDIAVLGEQTGDVAAQAAGLDGAARVLAVERAENAHPLAAVLAPQIAALAAGYEYLLMPSTTFGKDVLPRVAALLGVPQVSDVMEVVDPRTFKRPVYAGNVIQSVRVPAGQLVVATVRTASFQPRGASSAPAPIEARTLAVDPPRHTRFVSLGAQVSERPDLQAAARVVSGGRGVGSAENFKVIFSLADKLGAAVGASRAAVDAGYVPNELQVGQTGKIIAPELYVAVGISGAIQHLTGIKDARTIVAINKDSEAPIFEIADIGLVGDLFTLLPQLEAELDKSGR
jgi:electron transfer flavoprotein alpha subunit